MNTKQERAAFEAWASTQQGYGTADNPVNDCLGATRNAWKVWQAALASPEVQALRKDAERLDWLADPNNSIGNVQLPTECVTENLHSLRAAIDAARKEQSRE